MGANAIALPATSGQSGEGKQAQARPSFLKKRSKKLLPVLASAFPDRLSPDSQKFLVLFFKREPLSSFTRWPCRRRVPR
jgi:hypothetical protein